MHALAKMLTLRASDEHGKLVNKRRPLGSNFIRAPLNIFLPTYAKSSCDNSRTNYSPRIEDNAVLDLNVTLPLLPIKNYLLPSFDNGSQFGRLFCLKRKMLIPDKSWIFRASVCILYIYYKYICSSENIPKNVEALSCRTEIFRSREPNSQFSI